jgi:hypothetical protein
VISADRRDDGGSWHAPAVIASACRPHPTYRVCGVNYVMHVGVAPFPVKNRPETRTASRQSFPAAAGWLFARADPSSSGPSAARAGTHNHRAVIMGPRNGVPATHSASFRAFAPVFDGLWTRVNALLLSRGAPRGDDPDGQAILGLPSPGRGEGAIMPTAFGALFTFQTAHPAPAAHVCARGLRLCFTRPESRVGGAPTNVRVLGGTPAGRAMTRHARRWEAS